MMDLNDSTISIAASWAACLFNVCWSISLYRVQKKTKKMMDKYEGLLKESKKYKEPIY